MASFQLSCSLCPKRPNFSDLSHLLTHLASKGHLSHYFKAQVKSRQDLHMAQELQRFDKWYNDNDMEHLLHERLMQKEKKRPATRDRQPVSRTKDSLPATGRSDSVTRRALISQDSGRHLIDPQLHAQSHTMEQRASLQQSQAPRNASGLERDTDNELYIDPSHAITPIPYPTTFAHNRYPLRQSNARRMPNVRRHYNEAPGCSESPNLDSRSTSLQSGLDSVKAESDVEEAEEIEETSEYVNLKGVIWPGMDLFDSASPHSKRIRNQKKHHSCLEQMRTYAEKIEPNEDIYYYPSWELKQSREITGQVESSSPEREAPPPRVVKPRGRAKRSRGRPPLMSLDPNQLPIRRQPKRAFKEDFDVFDANGIPGLPSRLPRSRVQGHTRGSQPWTTRQDENLDWSLTFDPHGQVPKKRAVEIFKDPQDAPDLQTSRIPPYEAPERDIPRTPCPKSYRNGKRQHLFPSTELFKPPQVNTHDVQQDKENKEPDYDAFNAMFEIPRNDNCAFQDPFTQRYFTMDQLTSGPSFSKTAPPFMDFLMGYPNMPVAGFSPIKLEPIEEPPVLQEDADESQIHPEQHDPSIDSLNPLLDMSSLLHPNKAQESDDETIDDNVGATTGSPQYHQTVEVSGN